MKVSLKKLFETMIPYFPLFGLIYSCYERKLLL